ncbi:hypothetical protein V5735_04090 (plasmid) [Haladaptatus sp. SPP-AMP-3]|uniref:hypothetical protein n=1 Tax=Haladaptatus sp. SPP-AMP-3 TaxID=3121295 RepID=UPI003C2D3473
MENSDNLTEAEIQRAVKEGASEAGRSVLSTIFWTILAVFATLVGLQAVQIAFYTTGLAAIGFAGIGVVVTGASVYLLYLLHWS